MALTTFTSGQVLTAAQMNAVQANDYNQTVSTKTASYTLVAADKGTRVVMNSASATTITVNTSLFNAGDTLFLQNISTGVCTVTAGTATVSSAGPLAIPQNGSGVLYFTSAGVSSYYPSAVTVAPSASGLTLISATTIGTTVSSVAVSSVFSSTYENYMVIINGGLYSGVGSAAINMILGATTTGYYTAGFYVGYSTGTVTGESRNNGSSFKVGVVTPNNISTTMFMSNPNLAKVTTFTSFEPGAISTGANENYGGFLDNTTQYTGFTISPSTGTLTGGTIRVYGIANS